MSKENKKKDYKFPNKETQKVIKEARQEKNLIELKDIDSLKKRLKNG